MFFHKECLNRPILFQKWSLKRNNNELYGCCYRFATKIAIKIKEATKINTEIPRMIQSLFLFLKKKKMKIG